jgi:hypothetical protein
MMEQWCWKLVELELQ